MSEENYTVYDSAMIAFEKLTPRDGDIILIHFPDDIHPAQMVEFSEQLQPMIPEDVIVLSVRKGMTVNQISEIEMNKLGWYRFDTKTKN